MGRTALGSGTTALRRYCRIMVAVDNSPGGEAASEWGVALARVSGAALTAVHVYNARQHEFAFRKMEVSLPAEHRSPVTLAEQRVAHQTLIKESLALIAASYLGGVERRCLEEGVPFEGKAIEGKHYLALCEEAANHDLVCLGAHGLGWVPGSVIGGVCERVLRRCRGDVLVVKGNSHQESERRPVATKPPREIAVGVDGSDDALAAARRAAWLANIFDASLEGIYVFDPFFHRLAFGRMKGVLSNEAECLFRTGDQEVLHDTVIEQGLRQVGEKHLRTASEAAKSLVEHPSNRRRVFEMKETVLEGKPFLRISEHLEREGTDLLVVGRFGSHYCPEADIGNTAENLARFSPCSVLIVNSRSAAQMGG